MLGRKVIYFFILSTSSFFYVFLDPYLSLQHHFFCTSHNRNSYECRDSKDARRVSWAGDTCGKEITNESMPSSLPPLLSPSPCHLLLFFLLVSFIDFFSPPALQLIGEYLQIILLLLKLLLHVLSVFSSFFFLYCFSPPFLPPFLFVCFFFFLI